MPTVDLSRLRFPKLNSEVSSNVKINDKVGSLKHILQLGIVINPG